MACPWERGINSVISGVCGCPSLQSEGQFKESLMGVDELHGRKCFHEFSMSLGRSEWLEHARQHSWEHAERKSTVSGQCARSKGDVGVPLQKKIPSFFSSLQSGKLDLELAARSMHCERPVEEVAGNMGSHVVLGLEVPSRSHLRHRQTIWFHHLTFERSNYELTTCWHLMPLRVPQALTNAGGNANLSQKYLLWNRYLIYPTAGLAWEEIYGWKRKHNPMIDHRSICAAIAMFCAEIVAYLIVPWHQEAVILRGHDVRTLCCWLSMGL